MAKRLTVVVSQGQSAHPAKRKLEEDLVAQLMFLPGVDVTVVPNLYDLAPDGTGMLCLQGIAGDMAVLSWLFPRAAFWTLDRNGIRGRFGATTLKSGDDDSDDEDEQSSDDEQAEAASGKDRVAEQRETPNRTIYCIDLRGHDSPEPYVDEVRRIAAEASTQTVELMQWINGSPKPAQLERYLNPSNGAESQPAENGATNGAAQPPSNGQPAAPAPQTIDESADRRWYPVIDFSRCTNCMECIDFCLFGVYGVDGAETILVEQPDNCRKGCPACSRVCPENAIIFPQHKSPAIAGSNDAVGGLKIDLSQLFGAPSAVDVAAKERDEQLLLAGRDAVGLSVGVAKRQSGKQSAPKDDLDRLIDAADDF